MLATFIGRDGSLGLKYGQNYEIKAIKGKSPINIVIDNKIGCPYSTIEAFFANWKVPEGL